MMIKREGFTLAEVLITIAILGIIAALTLPALNSNITKQALERQTQKFYTQFANAISLFKADNESDTITGLDFNVDEFVKKYFSVLQKCVKEDKCYADSYAALDNSHTYTQDSWAKDNENTYILPDGTVFTIYYDDNESLPLNIYFDVNGRKGPNRIGNDFWGFSVYYDGSIDEGSITPEIRLDSTKTTEEVNIRFDACKTGNYGGCFGHFMRNHFKFDY